ncbi:MAG TPA: hypothetical protein VI362_00560 [Ignavibacteriaceae bacterium]|nr:hypothetical protein [Ignavibacteriaceae bacterium]
MKKIIQLLVMIILLTSLVYAQGTAGDRAKYEIRYLVDMPTAGILNKGFAGVNTDILPDGVMMLSIEAGIFENVSFGISYGGSNLISSGNVDWYNWPGVNIRARLLNESVLIPAIVLGFDSQGKGLYDDDVNRYQIKSPGFFGAVSKNFEFLGYFSLHGTVNYSLESDDGDNFVNIRVGVEKTLGSSFSLIAEYDFAMNDNSGNYGDEKGYLNMGIRWSVGTGFTLGFDLRDLLSNKSWSTNSADRSLRIEFLQSIF